MQTPNGFNKIGAMKADDSISIAYSSCPNDTFIFKAIARGLLDTKGLIFSTVLEDVETLNQRARTSTYDITKLSFAALGNLLDRYALLRTGAALGQGCGPLVVGLAGRTPGDTGKRPRIAVPGFGTTAYYLFRFFMDDRFAGLSPEYLAMPFEQVMPAVQEKRADFGVIIHEGRFVYPDLGLEMLADLGTFWEDKTSLPIPLGCIAVKRDMDREKAQAIQELIGESIDHAFAHPDAAGAYIREYAQEMEPDVIRQHIALYVNDFTRDIGGMGEAAVRTFFEHSRNAGLMPPATQNLFACL